MVPALKELIVEVIEHSLSHDIEYHCVMCLLNSAWRIKRTVHRGISLYSASWRWEIIYQVLKSGNILSSWVQVMKKQSVLSEQQRGLRCWQIMEECDLSSVGRRFWCWESGEGRNHNHLLAFGDGTHILL